MAEVKLIPLTVLQQLEIMEVETLNEITKSEIMERMFTRLMLSGTNKAGTEKMASMNHQKLFNLKETKRHVQELLKEEKEKSTTRALEAPTPKQ